MAAQHASSASTKKPGFTFRAISQAMDIVFPKQHAFVA
jgi:hypothetical protein